MSKKFELLNDLERELRNLRKNLDNRNAKKSINNIIKNAYELSKLCDVSIRYVIDKDKVFSKDIFNAYLKHIKMTDDELFMQSRERELVEKRWILFYILRCKGFTFNSISRLSGRLKHCTVLHGFQNAKNLLIVDEKFRNKYSGTIRLFLPSILTQD